MAVSEHSIAQAIDREINDHEQASSTDEAVMIAKGMLAGSAAALERMIGDRRTAEILYRMADLAATGGMDQ